MDQKRTVLIVDDDAENRELAAEILGGRFSVITASDGEEGVRLAREANPDLVLLDIRMPKLDGLATCEILRTNQATRHIPVIMLAAVSEPTDRINAFSNGADDFISKPFRPRELVARVLSKVRRLEEREISKEIIRCGNLMLDLNKLEVSINNNVVRLSVLEFSLLKYFVLNKERVMSRERILEAVWRDSVVSDRTVDAHIVSLRKKLVHFDHSLATIYGAGYVLKPLSCSS